MGGRIGVIGVTQTSGRQPEGWVISQDWHGGWRWLELCYFLLFAHICVANGE